MADVTPEAEALARKLWPYTYFGPLTLASCQRAIDAGWTPPPDPHEAIAREIAAEVWPYLGWGPVDLYPSHAAILAAVRRLDLRRADQ